MKNDPPLKLLRSSEKDEEKRLINSGEELGVIHVGAEWNGQLNTCEKQESPGGERGVCVRSHAQCGGGVIARGSVALSV